MILELIIIMINLNIILLTQNFHITTSQQNLILLRKMEKQEMKISLKT